MSVTVIAIFAALPHVDVHWQKALFASARFLQPVSELLVEGPRKAGGLVQISGYSNNDGPTCQRSFSPGAIGDFGKALRTLRRKQTIRRATDSNWTLPTAHFG